MTLSPQDKKRMSNEAENWLALLCGIVLVVIVLAFLNYSPSIIRAADAVIAWMVGFWGIW